VADTRKACCKTAANLSAPELYEGREDLTFQRCSVCQCRHFRAVAQGLGQSLKK
jgi:hypothetical protein